MLARFFTFLAVLALAAAQATTLNLDAAFNTDFIYGLIDSKLSSLGGIKRNSKLHTTVVQWGSVPGPVKPRAGAHPDNKNAIRVDVGVHVNTPWFCPAVDGSVTYYLWPQWDASSKRLSLKVDGWDTHTDLLSVLCQDNVNKNLQQKVPSVVGDIQSLVDFAFKWDGQRWVGCEHGTLSIDQELPGVLPQPPSGCPPPKPPPQCPPPRPVNKPPQTCSLQSTGDKCGTKKCVCRAAGLEPREWTG